VRLAVGALEEHDRHAGGGRSDTEPHPLAVIDSDGRLGGRGAYLCRDEDGESPRTECLERAIRRGSVARTLRAKVALDPKLVESVGR
jgi:predicted RNA-binding protein YlxR (DUF448 family)